MCVITNEDNIIIEISLIPGLIEIPIGWHLYFPVTKSVKLGDVYEEK